MFDAVLAGEAAAAPGTAIRVDEGLAVPAAFDYVVDGAGDGLAGPDSREQMAHESMSSVMIALPWVQPAMMR